MKGWTSARARIFVGVTAPLLLIVALCWPLLFADATFNEDWLNHLWYMWHQSLALREGHRPSLFLDYAGGVFYPLYAFYGATLYVATGLLSLALGDAPLDAYVLMYLLAFAAAYGGWYWLARSFGVRGWPAHVPGIVFVTAAPYLTMLYGLGDWPEFTSVSMMPLLIASALSVLRAGRLRFWPALALALSGVLFFGSHLLTVIWGTTALALATAAALLCIPAARRRVTRGGVARVAAILVPAGLLSAWFLLPTLAYESQTVIAHNYPHFRHVLRATMYTVAARHLFTLSRARDSGTVLTLALPVLAIAWTAGALALLVLARQRGTWMRAVLLGAAATTLLLLLMTHAGAILALPRLYATLQFAFRLESFALIGVSGTLLAALAAIRRPPPQPKSWQRLLVSWRWLLVPIALLCVLGALEQVGAHNRLRPRRTALASFATPTFEQEGLLNYVDDELPIIRKPLPQMHFAAGPAPGERLVASVPAGAGRRVDSNLRAGPDFLDLEGARIVATDAQANDVLELTAAPQPADDAQPPTSGARPAAGATRVAVSAAESLPIVAGRYLSLLALLVLAVELGSLAIRDARRHIAGRALAGAPGRGLPDTLRAGRSGGADRA